MSLLRIKLYNFYGSLSMDLSLSYNPGYKFDGLTDLTKIIFCVLFKKKLFSSLNSGLIEN